MIFIIEHLDSKVWTWSLLEYKQISSIVSKENLWFTNVKSNAALLRKLGKVFMQSVMLPSPYVLNDGKPVLAPGLVEMLRRQKGF